jgi:hypothetical protein
LVGLVITNGISALAALRTERTVVLVPPTLTQEVEITRNTASSELKESWGLYLAELLGLAAVRKSREIRQGIPRGSPKGQGPFLVPRRPVLECPERAAALEQHGIDSDGPLEDSRQMPLLLAS